MRTHPGSIIFRFAVAAMIMLALIPGSSAAVAQTAETSYTDEEYGITIGWTEQWEAELPTADSPILSLVRDSSIFAIISIIDGAATTPEDAIWFLYTDGDEIVDDRTTENPPHLTIHLPDVGMTYTSEAYAVNNGEAVVLVSIGTVPVLEDSAVGIAQNELTINGAPVMTGQPLDASGDSSATPEADSRISRTSRESTETPEASAEATAETGLISRTSREGSETPEPTEVTTPETIEEPTEEPTSDVDDSDQPGTYTGNVWGYTFSYDTAIWEEASTYDTPTVDGVRLDSASATVSFIGLSEYGADPVGCLLGEDEYFSAESENISDWEVATDDNGDPLWYEGDELAWGVFSYTFHSSSGTDVEFIDYISCETIPGEDAVMVVQMTSFPEDYNANLDAVLDILDTLEFRP